MLGLILMRARSVRILKFAPPKNKRGLGMWFFYNYSTPNGVSLAIFHAAGVIAEIGLAIERGRRGPETKRLKRRWGRAIFRRCPDSCRGNVERGRLRRSIPSRSGGCLERPIPGRCRERCE